MTPRQYENYCEELLEGLGMKSRSTCGFKTDEEFRQSVNDDFNKSFKILPGSSMSSYLDPKTSKANKLRVCSKALHPEFSYPLIAVSEMSIEKGYRPMNWLDTDNTVTAMYLIEAAQRHLDKLKMGIDINSEELGTDGLPTKTQPHHAAQVAYNCLMLILQQTKDVFIDDRLFVNGELKK